MANLPYIPQEIFRVGDSKEQLSSFPLAAKKRLGSGIYELRANARGDTFRVVLLLKLKRAVYVIDAFQKKSKRGSQTPKEVRERLKGRIAEARKHEDESSNGDQTE